MRWRRSPPAPPATEPTDAPQEEQHVTVSEETRRAELAAARAAADLATVRRMAPGIAESGEALEQENRHNGFYMLVRHALGSG